MIASAVLALMLAAAPPPQQGVTRTQFILRERVIVRVPTRQPPPPAVRWKAKKGPRCISAENLAAAALLAPDSIDLISRGGDRLRAELESACPAIDFYSGFYLMPSADRQVCSGRDAVHARSGGECQIKRFRKLLPAD